LNPVYIDEFRGAFFLPLIRIFFIALDKCIIVLLR
jgi:hypothetical protein